MPQTQAERQKTYRARQKTKAARRAQRDAARDALRAAAGPHKPGPGDRTYHAEMAGAAAINRANARQQRINDAWSEAVTLAQPIQGDGPAEQLECLRSRGLARAAELLSIPLQQMPAELLPIVLPYIAQTATRAISLAIRVDEGSLRQADAAEAELVRLLDELRAAKSGKTGALAGGGGKNDQTAGNRVGNSET